MKMKHVVYQVSKVSKSLLLFDTEHAWFYICQQAFQHS